MDTRTEALEEKVAWLENYVAELDGVVRGLGDELAALRAEVGELRKAAAARSEGGEGTEDADDALRYEVPPHY